MVKVTVGVFVLFLQLIIYSIGNYQADGRAAESITLSLSQSLSLSPTWELHCRHSAKSPPNTRKLITWEKCTNKQKITYCKHLQPSALLNKLLEHNAVLFDLVPQLNSPDPSPGRASQCCLLVCCSTGGLFFRCNTCKRRYSPNDTVPRQCLVCSTGIS